MGVWKETKKPGRATGSLLEEALRAIISLIRRERDLNFMAKREKGNTQKIEIRRAGVSDAAGILNCLTAAFEEYRALYNKAGYADTTLNSETVLRRLMETTIYVAVDEKGEVVGTVSWSKAKPDEGHLRGMAVKPEDQGSGVADCLIEQAEADMREKGCRFASLETMGFLKRSMHFYEKRGYCRTGQIKDFFGQPAHEFIKRFK
jgi:ribosomal protein S18 acetylase RimI-like enzyme